MEKPLALLLGLLLAAPAAADTSATSGPAEARALMQAWLDAQNKGDFAAYQALYAAGFSGIRRSGGRKVSLDRAGWLRDRARMFKKPMVVAASEVRAGPLRLDFVQSWQSGSYKDTGRKQLVLTREGGALRIVREEMLESVLAGAAPPLDAVRLEILKLLYPRGAERLLEMTVAPRPHGPGDGAQVALLVFGEPASGDAEAQPDAIELAVLTGKPGELALVARGRFGDEVGPEPPSRGTYDDSTYTLTHKLQAEPFALAPTEYAIGVDVEMVVHENGPNNGGLIRIQSLLFRVMGKEVRRVLSLLVLDDTGDAECDSGTRSSLAPAATSTAGVIDLDEEREVHTSRYDARGNCNDRYKTSTRRWVWKGKAYGRR